MKKRITSLVHKHIGHEADFRNKMLAVKKLTGSKMFILATVTEKVTGDFEFELVGSVADSHYHTFVDSMINSLNKHITPKMED